MAAIGVHLAEVAAEETAAELDEGSGLEARYATQSESPFFGSDLGSNAGVEYKAHALHGSEFVVRGRRP